MPMTQEERQCALEEFDRIQEALEDEFPSDSRWTLMVNHAAVAIAANRIAAMYAALQYVAISDCSRADMRLVGARIVNGANVGVGFPVSVTSLHDARTVISLEYHRMRLRAAADDLRRLQRDINELEMQATATASAIDVIAQSDNAVILTLMTGVARLAQQRYEHVTVGTTTVRDYVMLDAQDDDR